MLLDLERYKSVLCLHGDLPLTWLKSSTLPIIATDGAANDLITAGVYPAMIIGDCDSIHPDLLKTYPHQRIQDQNSTDFEKALQYLSENNQLPAIITGINGGFLDQIIANIGIFARTDALYYSDTLLGWVMNEGSHSFTFPKDTKISLFGCPQALITSEGLRWELKQSHLIFGTFCSSSNRVQTAPLRITVHKGKVLAFAYCNPVIDAGSIHY